MTIYMRIGIVSPLVLFVTACHGVEIDRGDARRISDRYVVETFKMKDLGRLNVKTEDHAQSWKIQYGSPDGTGSIFVLVNKSTGEVEDAGGGQ